MLHRVVAAGLQNVVEADHIAFDISVWVGDGVANSRLSTQIDHNIRVILLKNAVDKCLVRKVALDKGVVLELLEFSQTSFFDADVVVVIHVVQADDLFVRLCGKNSLGEIRADESRCPCNEYCFIIHFFFSPHIKSFQSI